MASRSIRWHLFQVLLISVFPIGLFAAGLLYLHWQAQEREREHSQIQSVRLLAAAVDNALDSTVQRLSIFAGLWAANPASDAVIYAQAREALAANPDWATIIAFRGDGTAVFRADEPFGATVPRMKLLGQWRPALDEKRPVVTDIFTGPNHGARVAAVGVPVVHAGKVTHVLIASLNLRWYDELVTRQGRGGVAGIFDRNWKFVARGVEGEERRGTDPSAPLVEDMKRSPEGIGKYRNLNGTSVYTSWASSRHGWWVALATPSAPVETAFWTYLGLLGCLWAVMVAAGIAYAISKGRHIARALVSVEARAGELADARSLARLPASRVAEVNRALRALEKASQRLQAAMRERDDSLQTEQKARAAAEAANRAKDEFLAMLGHELRNPLAAIWSAVEVMRRAGRTPQQVDFATDVVERQSRNLKRLIDDLLEVGRVVTGKVVLERGPLDLAAAVRDVAATLDAAGRFAQRRVEIDAAPTWIDGDPTRIEQIATNLLVNAATYTSPGGCIRVHVAREGQDGVLEVSDDGRGIAPESMDRVFELFYQGDATVDRSSGGLGIGLTLVRRLVELHGGTVTAQSAGRNKGASFRVRLPASAEAVLDQPAPVHAHPGAAQTILLVEDHADERETLRIALELHGHSVVQAADAHAAIELLRSQRPPVAILDIGLPGINGYELARMARAELGPALVLIALTGYGTEIDVRRAKAAGFDRHLTKPVEMQELLQVLERAGARADPRSNQSGLSGNQKIA
jgi:signal transduction histidine kinase/ActR/RegA family two-component response regulator